MSAQAAVYAALVVMALLGALAIALALRSSAIDAVELPDAEADPEAVADGLAIDSKHVGLVIESKPVGLVIDIDSDDLRLPYGGAW